MSLNISELLEMNNNHEDEQVVNFSHYDAVVKILTLLWQVGV